MLSVESVDQIKHADSWAHLNPHSPTLPSSTGFTAPDDVFGSDFAGGFADTVLVSCTRLVSLHGNRVIVDP